MSRELGVNVKVGQDIEVGGSYKTEFRAALVVPSCYHLHESEKKGFFKKKVWKKITHGKSDGSVMIHWDCSSKGKNEK